MAIAGEEIAFIWPLPETKHRDRPLPSHSFVLPVPYILRCRHPTTTSRLDSSINDSHSHLFHSLDSNDDNENRQRRTKSRSFRCGSLMLQPEKARSLSYEVTKEAEMTWSLAALPHYPRMV